MSMQQDSYKQHISAQYNAELEAVKNHLLEMGGMVEEQLDKALDCLLKRDSGSADGLIDADKTINRMEVDIDEECSSPGASRPPVTCAWC